MAREKTQPLYCWEMSLEEVRVYLTSSKKGISRRFPERASDL